MRYNIYVLIDPRNERVEYVGATKNLKRRFYQHISKKEMESGNIKSKWVKELVEAGMRPIIKAIEELLEEEWQEREKFWISYYRTINSELKNTTKGGKGASCAMSEETKAKVSKSKTGVKMSEEAVRKSADGHRGKKKSKEIRDRQSQMSRSDPNITEEEIEKNLSNVNSTRWQGRAIGDKMVGITRRKESGYWRARITFNKKLINLGSFDNEIDAARAYNEAALKYYGPNAKLNKI